MADFGEAMRIDPKYAIACFSRGNAWFAQDEYEKAIADYTEAIRRDSQYAYAFNNRGSAWLKKNDYDKAMADLDEAIRLDPKYAVAYGNRGTAWFGKKEYDRAIGDYSEAIRLDPKDASAYFYRSVARMILRRDDAVGGFKTAMDLEQGKDHYATYAVILGNLAARQLKNEADAKWFLDQASRLEAFAWPYPAVKFLRGELDEAGLLALAVDDGKKTEARCFLGLDHLVKGHKGEALAHFRWVRDHGPTAFIEYTIAMAELERLGEPASPVRK